MTEVTPKIHISKHFTMETFRKLCRQLSDDDVRDIRRHLNAVTDKLRPAYIHLDTDNAWTMLLSLHQITSDELFHRRFAQMPNPGIEMPMCDLAGEGDGAPISPSTSSKISKQSKIHSV